MKFGMYDLFAMAAALAAFVVLLRHKVKIGLAMVLSGLLLELLLAVWPQQLVRTFVGEFKALPLGQTTGFLFVSLASLLTFVNILGRAMKETGVSDRLTDAVQGLFKSRRAALCTIPLLMGLLPTPGGIMLSAPMVRDLGDAIGVSRIRTAAINFFFRHQWEMIWPLFPSIPLIQGMLGVSAFALLKYNCLLTLFGLAGGVLFLLTTGIPPKGTSAAVRRNWLQSLWFFLAAFWPIALVALLYAVFNLTPAVGLLIAIILFMLSQKCPLSQSVRLFRQGFEMDLVLLIFGALLYKLNLQSADSVNSIVQFFGQIHLPPAALLFILPMIVAAVTGLTMPTVAITFPLLMPFIGSGADAHIGLQTLAFSGLLTGLYLTPVHLCLSLSASYFDAPLDKLIAILIPPVACLAAAGIIAASVLN